MHGYEVDDTVTYPAFISISGLPGRIYGDIITTDA